MRHPRERGGIVGPGIGKPTGGGASARFSGKTLPFVVASRKVRSRRRLADECLSPSPHHPSRRRLAPPPLYRRRGRGDGRGGHHGRGRAGRADRGGVGSDVAEGESARSRQNGPAPSLVL